MTYPWPDVTLITLGEKQENSNCQQLSVLSLCTHIQPRMVTLPLKLWQTDLKINTRVWEGSDSKVVCPCTSSGCRHLQYKSSSGIVWQDAVSQVKVGVHVLDIKFMLSSPSCYHDYSNGANFPNLCIICRLQPFFVRSSDWSLLRQMLFTAVFVLLPFTFTDAHKGLLYVHKWAHLPNLAGLTVANILHWAELHRERKNIWISTGRAEGLLTCLVPWRENVRRHMSSYITTCNIWLVWWACSENLSVGGRWRELVCMCACIYVCLKLSVRKVCEIHP